MLLLIITDLPFSLWVFCRISKLFFVLMFWSKLNSLGSCLRRLSRFMLSRTNIANSAVSRSIESCAFRDSWPSVYVFFAYYKPVLCLHFFGVTGQFIQIQLIHGFHWKTTTYFVVAFNENGNNFPVLLVLQLLSILMQIDLPSELILIHFYLD